MNQSKASPMVAVMALVSGVLFGIGLTLSDMINPARVLGFLDVAGSWDPTLAFVMGGALLVTFPAFQLVKKLQKPLCSAQFQLPTSHVIDRRLVGGAALFGIGWGLVGFCPGPAIAALVTLDSGVFVFFLSMLVGMRGFTLWERMLRKG